MKGLPEFLRRRDANRGFEAMAWTAKRTLLLFLQSPLGAHGLIPVVEFSPAEEKTVGLYFYRPSPQGGKLGDAALLPDGRILLIEQNGKTGKKAWQKLVAVSLDGADNLIGAALAAGEKFDPPAADVKTMARSEVVDLSAQGFSRYEKLEGLALSPSGEPLIVNDNDFGISGNDPGSHLFILRALSL
ncbi:MAG: esterase-like activity of phytase family protein [Calothrix sp. SM1_5_4]|nr:esterase-like activity of phytase family protein [Calothrix sp. SM1_5_4]